MTEEQERRHAYKMALKKAAREKILATKTQEKGLIIVHTGKGKGKSTAAFGMVMRAIGHGFRVAVVQFVKGKWETGEKRVLEYFPQQVCLLTVGEGFTWETQDRQRDITAAQQGWQKTQSFLNDPQYKLVLLDELNIVLRDNYLSIDEVCQTLQHKIPEQHVIITGRNAQEPLIALADLVTDMTLVKHPFRSGIKAQKGIEF